METCSWGSGVKSCPNGSDIGISSNGIGVSVLQKGIGFVIKGLRGSVVGVRGNFSALNCESLDRGVPAISSAMTRPLGFDCRLNSRDSRLLPNMLSMS